MDHVNIRKIVLVFVGLAVAAGQWVIPDSAEAAGALFRVQRYSYGVLPTTHPTYTVWTVEPPSKGTMMRPSATANIQMTPSLKVTLPKGFIDTTGIWFCEPKSCWPGYPISGGTYSYTNGEGRFRENNPFVPSATHTIWFPTTRPSSTGMYTVSGGWYPNGAGDPVTPTTVYGGRYDFSRGGAIQVTPGPNKFSGSMRFINGPNAKFYQLITPIANSPYTSIAWGTYKNKPSTVETTISSRESTGAVTRYRVKATPTYYSTTTTTMGGATVMHPHTGAKFVKLTTGSGAPVYSAVAHYLETHGNWLTGMVQGYNPIGTYQTRWTKTGYDNRTPDGLSGNLSLVRPRLRHTYLVTNNPSDPITSNYQALRISKMVIMFSGDAPEPGAVLMLGFGIATLVGLTRLRKR